jgi:iron complex outermembrane receptor protein
LTLAGGSALLLVGLMSGAPAMAQSTAPAAPTSGGAAESGTVVQDIVVTAQRRSERLSDVPMSVTAVGGKDLTAKGVLSTLDLDQVVPGLVMQRATNSQQPTIRGIGTRNVSPGDEPNVATHLDGVYLPDAVGTLFDLSNIERIEVLKGPQGTLFGRNATGGAINIVTREPRLDEMTGLVEGTYGRFNYHKVDGFLSAPIVRDKLAVSVTAADFGDDGYVRNLYLHTRQGRYDGQTVRGRLLFQPTDKLKIGLNALYAKVKQNLTTSAYNYAGNSQALLYVPGRPNAAALNPTNIPASLLATSEPWTTVTGIVPLTKIQTRLYDAHLDYDFGFATLSALASYGETGAHNYSLSDYSSLNLSQPTYFSYSRSKNQEIVLTSPGDQRVTWLAGLSFFQGIGKYDPVNGVTKNATTGALAYSSNVAGQRSHSTAAFAEATWEIVDNLFLTGGVRWTREKKDAFFTPSTTRISQTNSATFKNTSPRAVLRYKFSPGSNVYVSFSKGFKSGIFNPLTPAGIASPARPEIVKAWEAGAKVALTDWANLDVAAFKYDYTDLQVSTIILAGGVQATTVFNAANARVKGLEATLSVRPVEHLSLSAGLSLLDTKFISFPKATTQIPKIVNGVVDPTGYITTTVDATGKHLIRAPASTLNLAANWNTDLYGGILDVDANALISSKYYGDVLNSFVQPGYEVVNAAITWRQHRDRGVSVSVFGKNLTNQVYALGFTLSSFTVATQANKPRWFGVTVGYRY